MRGSLFFGALLALAACLYVPYRYSGTELVMQKSTGASFHHPIDGVSYAPIWDPPSRLDLTDYNSPADYTTLPSIESIALDGGRLLATLGAIAALTMLLAVGTRREAVSSGEAAAVGTPDRATTEVRE